MVEESKGTIPLSPHQAEAGRSAIDASNAPTVSASCTQAADFAAEAQLGKPTTTANHVALPRGYVLQEYTIEAVLGVGGFGITYLAQDNNLRCRVAIKEYLPNDLAIRTGGQTVLPRSDSDTQGYTTGLERFLAETRVLATFRHHNIVRVGRFFEANHTAYMVMDYEQGESLRSWIESHGPVDEATVLRMFLPLLEGLETVHKAGVVHRDIKPANLYVRDADASLVLLDFGAARQTTGGSSKSLTSIITPGYAPFEQYHTRGAQGPWTDLYALGGVMYWLVTGQKPVEAPSRMKDDPLVPAVTAAAGRFSHPFLQAIDWALSVDENHRPRSVTEFRAVLTGEAPLPQRRAAAIDIELAPTPQPAAGGKTYLKFGVAGAAAALVAVILFMMLKSGDKPAAPVAPAAVAAGEAAPPPAAESNPAKAKPGAKKAEVAQAKAVQPASKSPSTPARTGTTAAGASTTQPAAGGATALLTFQVVPASESAELVIDEKSIGRVPPIKEYRLPAGRHKVELYGDKRPRVYHYWVNLEPNEKKHIWARFADEF